MEFNESEVILRVARGFLGIKEKPGNMGFDNKQFEEGLISVGWDYGLPWCDFAAEYVWRTAYAGMNSVIEAAFRELFSGLVTRTYANFKKSKEFKQYVSNEPLKGSLVCFRHGNTYKGHMGILASFNKKEMLCYEGNTNMKGSRDGDGYYDKKRIIDFTPREKGLYLLGFIHPPKIDCHG